MTLLYRVGDEIILHAPREVLKAAVNLMEAGLCRYSFAPDMEHQVQIFINSLRAESQHEEVSRTEDWMTT